MQKKSFFQRNWYFFTPAFIVAIPLLMGVFSMLSWGYTFKESMNALLHFGSTDTRYSIGFGEDRFRLIRPGMRGDEVYKIVKNPFERRDDDTLCVYSLPDENATYYHERTLILAKDTQGVPRVKSVVRRFHTPEMNK